MVDYQCNQLSGPPSGRAESVFWAFLDVFGQFRPLLRSGGHLLSGVEIPSQALQTFISTQDHLAGLLLLHPLKKFQKRCSRTRSCRKISRDRGGARTRGETPAHTRTCRFLPEFEPATYCKRLLAIPLCQTIVGRYIGQ